MSVPISALSCQARLATGSLRAQVCRANARGQARFASSSSSSSSSARGANGSAFRVKPVVLVATAAFIGSVLTISSKSPLALESAQQRKSYWERMKIEEKERQEAKAEAEKREEAKEDPAKEYKGSNEEG